MTCTGCQKKISELLSRVEGVNKVMVDLEKGEADIEMDAHIPTIALQAALHDYPKYQLSDLVPEPVFSDVTVKNKGWFETYKPILLIFFYITAVSMIAATAGNHLSITRAMRFFMAGFFIVFSFFKMLDLEGFADSYSMYDIVARKFRKWGYVYAFIELALGLAFAADIQPVLISYITLGVMSVSIIGVLQSVLNKRKIKCACLGAVFNLPMSTVTVVEDSLMIAMSIAMLIIML
jgi:hypothetical protein